LILLDTNILLRYARTADPAFATVDTAINGLHASGEVLCVVPQNLYEFWAIATRPTASNRLGLSVPECQNSRPIESVKEGRMSHHSGLRLLQDGPNAGRREQLRD
jgi:predicted nucleic acid-binding protein